MTQLSIADTLLLGIQTQKEILTLEQVYKRCFRNLQETLGNLPKQGKEGFPEEGGNVGQLSWKDRETFARWARRSLLEEWRAWTKSRWHKRAWQHLRTIERASICQEQERKEEGKRGKGDIRLVNNNCMKGMLQSLGFICHPSRRPLKLWGENNMHISILERWLQQ